MEKLLAELAVGAPAAVAVIITVILFLRAQGKRDSMLETLFQKTVARESEVLEALQQASQSFGRMEATLDRLDRNHMGRSNFAS